MKRKHRLGEAKASLIRQQERLTRVNPLQMGVMFTPFLAVIILSLYTSLETNTRLFSVARPLEHLTAESDDHELWLSLAVNDGTLLITSADGKSFSWPASGPDKSQLLRFEEYLREQAQIILLDTTRKGQLTGDKNTAAISVDQNLTYHHIRPVIYALAGAGFSKYGFETRIVR